MDTKEPDISDPRSLNKYLFCEADPIDKSDPSGLEGIESVMTTIGTLGAFASFTSAVDPIVSRANFKVLLGKDSHYHTDVRITFFSEFRKKSGCECKHPKLAQIALNIEDGLVRRVSSWADWKLDTAKGFAPWYPAQQEMFEGAVEMEDSPKWLPNIQIWGATQLFETCAICTDEGANKYLNLGCVNWGHSVAGYKKSRRWGDGDRIWPVPPSLDFLKLFPPRPQ